MPHQRPGDEAPHGMPLADEGLRSLRMLFTHLRTVRVEQPHDGWIGRDELLEPRRDPLAALLGRIGERYVDSRRNAAAASFMLRFGWSVGPMIAAHLGLGCRLRYLDYALRFVSSTAIEAVCIRHGETTGASDADTSRRRLVDALLAHTEPVLDAQHRVLRVGRGVLWSMVTSTWAALFIEIGERLGDAELGRREAVATLELLPATIRRAAPRLYRVAGAEGLHISLVRAACCLSHKGPSRRHCMVCPLNSEDERAARSSAWAADRTPIRALDAASMATLRKHATKAAGA